MNSIGHHILDIGELSVRPLAVYAGWKLLSSVNPELIRRTKENDTLATQNAHLQAEYQHLLTQTDPKFSGTTYRRALNQDTLELRHQQFSGGGEAKRARSERQGT